MPIRVHPAQGERDPHVRLTRLVIDHLFHAKRYPERMAVLAQRLRVSPTKALAIAITEHIIEEFTVTPREQL